MQNKIELTTFWSERWNIGSLCFSPRLLMWLPMRLPMRLPMWLPMWLAVLLFTWLLIWIPVSSVSAEEPAEKKHHFLKQEKISQENDDTRHGSVIELDEELIEFLSDFEELDEETFALVLFHGLRDSEKHNSDKGESQIEGREVNSNE